MLNSNTYVSVENLLEYLQQNNVDFQIPFFKIYNSGAGATVQITDTTIILVTTDGGTDTLTFADADKNTISELIIAINNLAKGWVVNRLCQTDQSSTNLWVLPATACVGASAELTLTGYDNLYLENLINRMTDSINTYLRRSIKTATYTNEFYDGRGELELILKNYPITTLTKVEYYDKITASVTWTLTEDTDFIQYADEGYLYKGSGWANGHKNIRITYTAGYTTVPEDIILALLKLCSYEIMAKGKSGIESERIGDYSISFTGAKANKVSIMYIPEDIQGLLLPYKRILL